MIGIKTGDVAGGSEITIASDRSIESVMSGLRACVGVVIDDVNGDPDGLGREESAGRDIPRDGGRRRVPGCSNVDRLIGFRCRIRRLDRPLGLVINRFSSAGV